MAIKRCFFVYAVYVPLVYKYAFFCGIWPQVFGLFALFCACWLLLRFGSLASSQNMAFFGAGLNAVLNALFCGFFSAFFALGSLRISLKNHVTKCYSDFPIFCFFSKFSCKTCSGYSF